MTGNLPTLRPVTSKRPALQIGIRYTPRHIVRRDDDAGTFEELNSPLESFAESAVQSALLWRPRREGLIARLARWLLE